MKEQKISLSTAILLNMNIMIGSGILIGPGAAAAISGNASFLTWPIVALIFLPIVLCTIELSRLFPGAGGFYLYAKQGLGKTAGFAAGWLYILGYTFAAAVETLALRNALIHSLGTNFIFANSLLFNALLLAATVVFSLLSLKLVSNFLNSLTLAKMLPLVVLILLLPFIFNPSFTITSTEFALLPASLVLPIFGYMGFEYCVSISHLIKDSEKNAPRAILIGFIGTGLLYMLFHFGLLNLMGTKNLIEVGAPAFADYINLPIPYLRTLLKILIPTAAVLTLYAGLLGMLNANAILLQSMASEGLFKVNSFFRPLTGLGRPWAALIIQAIVVFFFAAFIPNIPVLGGLTILGVLLAFFLSFLSLLIVQRRVNARSKLPVTIIGIILVLILSGYMWYTLCPAMAERMMYTLILLSGFALGMALFKKENSKQVA